jgi:chitinase
MDILKDFGIAIWLKNGAPAHKLVLGIPLFARSFLLARADQHELHSPTVGNGTEGPFTRSAGFLSYFEVSLLYKMSFLFYFFLYLKVCLLQTDPKWEKRGVSDGSESEYMFKDRDWISYDTIENIQKRAAYVVANNLGGMFVWSRM